MEVRNKENSGNLGDDRREIIINVSMDIRKKIAAIFHVFFKLAKCIFDLRKNWSSERLYERN